MEVVLWKRPASDNNTRDILQSSLQWARQRWARCSHLLVELRLPIHETDAAALADLFEGYSPKSIKRLELITGYRQRTAAGLIFEALLATLRCDAPLEMLHLGCKVQTLPRLVNMRHLHLHDVSKVVNLADLLAPLSFLEILELGGADDGFDVKLGHLQKLQHVVLDYVTITALELPPSCTLSIFALSYHVGDMYWCCPDTRQVIFLCVEISHTEDWPDLGGKLEFLYHFERAEALDIDCEVDPSLEDPSSNVSMPYLHWRAICPLRYLTCLRLRCELGDMEELEFIIPESMALKSLIIVARVVNLSLESPSRLCATLEELIFACDKEWITHADLNRACNAEVSGWNSEMYEGSFPEVCGDFLRLSECYRLQGDVLQRVSNEGTDDKHGFVYLLKQGLQPRRYEQLTRRSFGCLCGICWCCRYHNGDKRILRYG